jgi:hypothetical protein
MQCSQALNSGRHDEKEEIEADRIRAEIRASHRFDSFADERAENFVKWCVCLMTCGRHFSM